MRYGGRSLAPINLARSMGESASPELWRGLKSAYINPTDGVMRDDVSGITYQPTTTSGGGMFSRAGKAGPAYSFETGTTADSGVKFVVPFSQPNTSLPFTICIVFELYTLPSERGGNQDHTILDANISGTGTRTLVTANNDDTLTSFAQGTGHRVLLTSSELEKNRVYTVVITGPDMLSGTNAMRWYVDGNLKITDSMEIGSNLSVNSIRVGGYNDDTRFFDGAIYSLSFWDREMPE